MFCFLLQMADLLSRVNCDVRTVGGGVVVVDRATALPYTYTTQTLHDQVVAGVVAYVQREVMEGELGMRRVELAGGVVRSGEGGESGESGYVYASQGVVEEEHQKETLVLVVQGRGVGNRCGVWDACKCVEEEITRNSQIPYLRTIAARQWDVIVLNPNQPHVYRGPHSRLPIKNVEYVWESLITARTHSYTNIYIIAHTHGAQRITNLLESYDTAKEVITKICFIDGEFRHTSDDICEVLATRGKTWVSCSLPAGTTPPYHPLTLVMPCVSAGDVQRPWAACQESVFEFLSE